MKTLLFVALFCTFAAWADWTSEIRRDHPRLYVNSDTLPEVRKYALQHCSKALERLRKEVDALPEHPAMELLTDRFEFVNGKIKYRKPYCEGSQIVRRIGANEAVKCATLYLLDNKSKYHAKGVAYLKTALQFFQWCYEHEIMVDWHTESRINASIAYDWLYNGMTDAERRSLILPLLDNIRKLQPGGGAKFLRCTGGPYDGNYGVNNLAWFAGLAAFGDGYDDKLAGELLQKAYRRNIEMMNYRDKVSGGTGLLSAATHGYSFGAYPYATFHFLHCMESATGKNLAAQWTQMRQYPRWFGWMQIPKDGHLLTYGIGDMAHTNNRLDTRMMYTHMAQSIHFYPECAPEARRLMKQLPARDRKFHSWFPFLPFVLTRYNPDAPSAAGKEAKLEKSACFPSFGLVIMRSGATQADTHALFRSGALYGNHQHYDESSFVIFKHDFLALDSGSRTSNMHHCNYAPQSVAHNTILIHQEKEPVAPFWKPWGSLAEVSSETVYSHGGQYRTTGAKNLAYRATEEYTYAANDATGVYRNTKCREAVRQFVFIQPDYFVVFDRVKSVRPDQRKEYLLHVQNEPVELGKGLYRADNGRGRIFQQTLWPRNAVIEKVGGPGKQFLASGRNWPLPGGESVFKKPNYFGQWRLQIRDAEESDTVCFLHVIQASDTATPAPVAAALLEEGDTLGAAFTDRSGKRWEIRFNRKGKIMANINGETL